MFHRVYQELHSLHTDPLRNMHIGTRHHECGPDSGHRVLWNGQERIGILCVDDEQRKFLQSDVFANLSGLREERDHPRAQRGLYIYKERCSDFAIHTRKKRNVQFRQESRSGLERAMNWSRKFEERVHRIVEHRRALLARSTLVCYSQLKVLHHAARQHEPS